MISPTIRPVAGLAIVTGIAIIAFQDGSARDPSVDGSNAIVWSIGAAAVLAAVLVELFGEPDRWGRAALTGAGTIGGLALLTTAGVSLSPGLLIGMIAVGAGCAVLQYAGPRPSAALAAMAVGVTAAGILAESATGVLLLVALGAVVSDALDMRSWGPDAEGEGVGFDRERDFQPDSAALADGDNEYERTMAMSNLGRSNRLDAPAPEWRRSPSSEAQADLIAVSVGDVGEHSADESDRSLDRVPSVLASDREGPTSQPYLTIGAEPKLLRSTDVSPPRISHSTPAGHQFDGFRHRDFIIRGASHVGTKHMHNGQVRQDAYAVGCSADDKFVVAAVADGVGSEAWSALGAEWAVSTAVQYGVAHIDERGGPASGQAMADFAAAEVRRRAEQFGMGTDDQQFSTTLIVAVLDCANFVADLTRVGDSSAFGRGPQGWLPLFEESDQPGAATNAIPADSPVLEHATVEFPPGGCLLMVTDGIGDLIANAAEVHDRLYDALVEPVTPLEFSSIAGFQRRQAHDDQTAVAIWLSPAQQAGAE